MISKLHKATWAERNNVERSLIGALALSVVCFGLLFWAWMVQLRPWAPVWGTWADWVAATGTVLGFGAAVFTLRKNARDQKNQRQEDVLAEASRVVMTLQEPKVDFDDKLDGSTRYSYRGTVHNAASSPVRKAHVHLDASKLKDQRTLEFLQADWDLGTIPVGGEGDFIIQVNSRGTAPRSNELIQAMNFLFTDVHGHTWKQTTNKLSQEKLLAGRFERTME